MLNCIQYWACLHLSVQNVWRAHFFLDTLYVVHDIGRMIIVMSQVWLVYVITSQMYFIARDVCCVVYAAAAAAAAADDDDDGDDDDDDVGT